ncbi:helix-turn-helix domain-containing protein [Streptomyces zaomyceticus]|uniref:helix-turn-helix domain-containing protein n=1 Tax=Streptomyces zaomyceticus TaxID=68286 RepID=UPI00341DD613
MPGWKSLPDELDPEVRAFTERIRRLIDRSGLGVTAVAERTGHERSAWDAYLNARLPAPRAAVVALAEVTGTDPAGLATDWERAERARAAAPARPEGDGDGHGDGGEGPGVTDSRAPAAGDAPDPRGPGDDRTMEIRRPDRPRPAGTPVAGAAVPPAGITVPPPGASAPSPRTPAPGAPRTAGAPARTPGSRRRGVLLYAAGIVGALLVVTAALLLVDLGGSDGEDDPVAAPPATTAPPATKRASLPPGVNCSGPDCTGQDPEAMGCGGPLATTVAVARVGGARVEVRYSGTCAAAWARITGAAPRDTVTVEAGETVRRATVAPGTDTATVETDAYTPMVAVDSAAAAKACGLLADGNEGCTEDR